MGMFDKKIDEAGIKAENDKLNSTINEAIDNRRPTQVTEKEISRAREIAGTVVGDVGTAILFMGGATASVIGFILIQNMLAIGIVPMMLLTLIVGLLLVFIGGYLRFNRMPFNFGQLQGA